MVGSGLSPLRGLFGRCVARPQRLPEDTPYYIGADPAVKRSAPSTWPGRR